MAVSSANNLPEYSKLEQLDIQLIKQFKNPKIQRFKFQATTK